MFKSYRYFSVFTVTYRELIGTEVCFTDSLILKVRLSRKEKVKEIDQERMKYAIWIRKHRFR